MYTHGFTETDVPTDEFPLRCSGFHYRGRTHSSWGGIELLKEVNPQEAWINPADAKERSIKQGDKIRVKNAFGEIEILAKVTPRVVPGTVCISQGAWHDADMYGDRVDKGGCINTLTTHRPSPLAKGNPQHSNICQVTKRRATSRRKGDIPCLNRHSTLTARAAPGARPARWRARITRTSIWASRSATCTR